MAELVKTELAAERVFVFDYRFRVQDSALKCLEGSPSFDMKSAPVHVAHLDQTPKGGEVRIKLHLTEEESAEYLSGNWHVRIVNVWRSFNDTPFDMPLAMCLPDSVSDQEFCKVDLVGRERAGESWYLHHNPDQKWLWASDMKSSEVLAFVTWDSTYVPGEMKCACHTAFPNPVSGPLAQRKSLETWIIVVSPLSETMTSATSGAAALQASCGNRRSQRTASAT